MELETLIEDDLERDEPLACGGWSDTFNVMCEAYSGHRGRHEAWIGEARVTWA